MKWFNMSSSTYRSPVFIGLLVVMSVALVLLLHHCILVSCCNGERIRRGSRRRGATARQQEEQPEESVGDLSSSSRVQLVAKPVVCRYRKDEEWSEPTCPVCLADFADGEAVSVLPACMHYFHAACVGEWMRARATCPLCRSEPESGVV